MRAAHAFRNGRQLQRGYTPGDAQLSVQGLGWKADYVALFDEHLGKLGEGSIDDEAIWRVTVPANGTRTFGYRLAGRP